MTRPERTTAIKPEVAQLLSSPTDCREQDRYEAGKQAWIARQLENCPPLSERQKQIIRTAFTAYRDVDQAGAA